MTIDESSSDNTSGDWRKAAAVWALGGLLAIFLAQRGRLGGPLMAEPAKQLDWTPRVFWQTPKTYPVPDTPRYHSEGVKGLFFEGLPYKGRPTRVFCWYGCPAVGPSERVPAVILAHGGGGTAFAEWVRIWNARGYAAIAVALEGQGPGEREKNRQWPRHKWSGPRRRGFFTDVDLPVEDQWAYHAVGALVMAHSLVRSFPKVDPNRIGLTGISWGGILACIVAGVDARLKFVIPVYGCGFLYETPLYSKQLRAAGPKKAAAYRSIWEPSNFLPKAKMPMLWVNGANDRHFPLNALAKSCRAAGGPSTLCVRVGMRHGHRAGWQPKEIYAFADSIVKGGPPLPQVKRQGRHGRTAWVEFDSVRPIKKAELVYTTDPKDWVQCVWRTRPARVENARARASVMLPNDCAAWFMNLTNAAGLLESTVCESMPKESTMSPSRDATVGADAVPQSSSFFVYIGTYTKPQSEGIYVCRFDPSTGELTPPELAAETRNPSFLAVHPNNRFLYAVSEISHLHGKKSGGVSAFEIEPETGALKPLNQMPSGGAGPCHLVVDKTGSDVLVANYGSGSVAVLPIREDGRLGEPAAVVQHEGSSVNPKRQRGPHAHSINLDAANRFAFAADLGLDKILVYRFDPARGTLVAHTPPFVSVKPGAGPRHLAFHPTGAFAYVINELDSTVAAFAYDPARGVLTPVQTITTLPEAFHGVNYPAEVQVHPSGRFLYGSNRRHDSIVVYAIDTHNGTLRTVEHISTQGKEPRNFAIDPTGAYLLAANQNSDSVVVFRIDAQTGHLRATGKSVRVPMPVCLKFVPTPAGSRNSRPTAPMTPHRPRVGRAKI